MNTHTITSVILHSSPKNGGTNEAFTEEYIEYPFQIDTRLYGIVIEIFRVHTYEEVSRVFRGISRKTFDLFRSLKTRNIPIRHFTGVLSVSFYSSLSVDDFLNGIHKNYSTLDAFELSHLNDPSALLTNELIETNKPKITKNPKANELLKKFSLIYWNAAARQAAASKRLCSLCFGLSAPIVDELAIASSTQIEHFAKYYSQQYKLVFDDIFIQAIPSIENAAENPNASFLKAAYAMQNTGAFKHSRHTLSTTATYTLADVLAKTPKRNSKKMAPVYMALIKEQERDIDEQNVKFYMAQMDQKKKSFASSTKEFDLENSFMNFDTKQKFLTSALESKKLCFPFLHAKELKNNQVATLLLTTDAQVRNITSKIPWSKNDGRQHKQQSKKDSDDSRYIINLDDASKDTQTSVKRVLHETFFLSLYFTLADEKGTEEIDLFAFFTAYSIMNKVTFKTQLKFSEHIAVPEAWDIVKHALQGLYQVQRCPVCGLISFYPRKRGTFATLQSSIYSCCIDHIFAKDLTLGKFSEYLQNSLAHIPEDLDNFLCENRCVKNKFED